MFKSMHCPGWRLLIPNGNFLFMIHLKINMNIYYLAHIVRYLFSCTDANHSMYLRNDGIDYHHLIIVYIQDTYSLYKANVS